jgi:hypothetical protein
LKILQLLESFTEMVLAGASLHAVAAFNHALHLSRGERVRAFLFA